jgi:hypothetical protein
MSAVSDELIEIIKELQSLPSLSKFSLAGGTNLALRYNHRKSVDIDLIVSGIVGISGFKSIINEVEHHFHQKNTKVILMNEELGEQFLFLRIFITRGDITVKIEFLQNMFCTTVVEIHNDVRVVSKIDIGLFKMMSASNRMAKKDIYDLAFITDEIPLITLYNNLKAKSARYNDPIHRSIFDLDNEVSPVGNVELLLEFDNRKHAGGNKPFHSDDRIDIVKDGRTWPAARLIWRQRVRELYGYLGKDFPEPQGIPI